MVVGGVLTRSKQRGLACAVVVFFCLGVCISYTQCVPNYNTSAWYLGFINWVCAIVALNVCY